METSSEVRVTEGAHLTRRKRRRRRGPNPCGAGAGAAGVGRRRRGAWGKLERGRGGCGAPAAGGARGGEGGGGRRSSRRVSRTPCLGFRAPKLQWRRRRRRRRRRGFRWGGTRESAKRFPAEREGTNCVAWHASPSTALTKVLQGV